MEYPDPVCPAKFTQKSSSQRHLPAKAPGNPDTLEAKSCKPRFFQAAACCAIGCTSCRRPVSTSKIRPRTGTSFLVSGQARFNASGTGGRCSPSPTRPYGARARSLRAFEIGRQLVQCSFVVEHRVSPPAAFRKSLAVLFDDESLGKDVWHIHDKRRLSALLRLPLCFTIMDPRALGRRPTRFSTPGR
jgi:hypothetical protein